MDTILIVDDRPANRQFLITLLGYAGYRLLEAADGQEALDILRTEKPDLVVTDLLTPTMDGFEFVQNLRADSALASTKVIFYTATYRATQARLLAQASGVDYVIAKPAEPQLILETVQAALGVSSQDASLAPVPAEASQRKPTPDAADFQSLRGRMAGVSELGLKLLEVHTPEEMLREFCAATLKIMRARYAAVAIVSEDEKSISAFITGGLDAETVEKIGALPVGKGVLGRVLAERRIIRLADIALDPQRAGFPAHHPPMRSFMGVPIFTATRLYGICYYTDRIDAEQFNAEDEGIAEALASQLAILHENMQLYDQLQRHAAELQLEMAERKRAEEQTRYQAELLAKLNDAVIASDENFRITAWNRAAEQIYGWSAEEAVGQSSEELLSSEFMVGSRAEAIAELREQGEFFATLIQTRRDGSRIYVEARAASLRDGSGRIVGYVSVNRDVTERKQAEEALRKSEETFAVIFNKAPFAAALTTLPDGRYLEVNAEFERLFGFRREEAIGRTSLELGLYPDPEERARSAALFRAQGFVHNLDIRLQTRTGEIHDVLINSDLVEIGGEKYILTTANDITERKRAEDELHLSRDRLAGLSRRLVESQETERRAIGRELHDQIGQMLTALKLMMATVPQLEPQLREKKHSQVQELVDELLHRVSALSLELRPPMLDDLGLIPTLLWHVNRYQEQTGIQVKFKHSGVEGKRFLAEIETTAFRIVQEALTNVARHAQAKRARLEVDVVDGHMELLIEDNGQGFDPQAAMAEHRSSGLGGMRERTSLMGGTFQIESQPDRGTKIRIRLHAEAGIT